VTNKREDLKDSLQVAKEMGWFGLGRHGAIWDTKSRNTLSDDLGEYEDSRRHEYDLDGPTRDRLIAHARQDAAMAFYAAADAHKEAAASRLLSWLSFLLLLAVLYKVW
jgi:hypothetical protein